MSKVIKLRQVEVIERIDLREKHNPATCDLCRAAGHDLVAAARRPLVTFIVGGKRVEPWPGYGEPIR
jgi:hypothetical protein